MATNTNVAQLSVEAQEMVKSRSHWDRALDQLKRDRLTQVAMAMIAFLTLVSILAEPIGTYILGTGYAQENLQNIYAPPAWAEGGDPANILGTDNKGRDHLARLLKGGQISLQIAFFASALSMAIGVTLGIATGFYGGLFDDVVVWFITTLGSIPQLYLLLIISAILAPSPVVFTLILGLLGWIGTMRLVRGETLSLRQREFVIAARAMGASDWRVMFQHVFPNLLSIVIVNMAIDIGTLILAEAALSFLGFGINPPTPTWGNMLSNSQQFFRKAPHLVWAPGILISVTVLCLYIVGDGLRDALDPTVSE
jgi:peptide/nickel transport system permease protein